MVSRVNSDDCNIDFKVKHLLIMLIARGLLSHHGRVCLVEWYVCMVK